jgi:hypothetical protein
MDNPIAGAELTFSVDVDCPHCHGRNRHHQLSAVHTNIKNMLNKGEINLDVSVDARCTICDKWFRIKKLRFA